MHDPALAPHHRVGSPSPYRSRRADRFPRLFAERVVIVAGILIALSAESWWEDHQDGQRETEYLEAFHGDLEATLAVRDLVASGGTTLISNLEVRSAMGGS